MRVRDGIAVWLTMLAFVPALVADDQTPEQKDQPQTQADTKANQQQVDQQQTEKQNNPQAQTNTTDKMQESMAACLALANHAEIELAKVAIEKTQNADVRALAQQMLDDHTAAGEKLKQFMPRVAAADQNAEGTATERKELANQHHDPMQQLMQKIAKNELAMTKEVLLRYEGQDFDMGYLGQQIIAHTQMLAKLHAMEDQGSPEFQTTVKELIGTIGEHFKHATQLSRKLEDREDRPARTTASTTNDSNTRRAANADSESQENSPEAPKERNLEKAGDRQDE